MSWWRSFEVLRLEAREALQDDGGFDGNRILCVLLDTERTW